MIKGAAQADVAALVVSASKGEFESGFIKGGQTNEHAQLVKSMGVDYLVVLVNKMDTVEWNQDRFTEIRDKLKPFLKDDCGYDVENNVKWVPISGFKDQNIHKVVDKKIC